MKRIGRTASVKCLLRSNSIRTHAIVSRLVTGSRMTWQKVSEFHCNACRSTSRSANNIAIEVEDFFLENKMFQSELWGRNHYQDSKITRPRSQAEQIE